MNVDATVMRPGEGYVGMHNGEICAFMQLFEKSQRSQIPYCSLMRSCPFTLWKPSYGDHWQEGKKEKESRI